MTCKQGFGLSFSLSLILFLAYSVWQRTMGPIEENVLAPVIPMVLMLYFTAKDLRNMRGIKKRKLA